MIFQPENAIGKDRPIDISFIIPTYEIPSFALERCLKSIVELKNATYEVIVVVDGDGHLQRYQKVSDELGSKLSNLRVINAQHGGVASARNVGIKEAVGTWIVFMDADDALNAQGLAAAIEKTKVSGEVAFITMNHTERYRANDKNVLDFKTAGDFTSDDCFRNLMNCTNNMGMVWAKLFNRDFLISNSLRFNESLSFGEDCEFILRVSESMKDHNSKFRCVINNGYYYYRNIDSETKRFSRDYLQKFENAFAAMENDIIKNDEPKEMLNIFIAHVLLQVTVNYIFNLRSDTTIKEKKKMFREVRGSRYFSETLETVDPRQFSSRARGYVFSSWKKDRFFVLYIISIIRQFQFRFGLQKWN